MKITGYYLVRQNKQLRKFLSSSAGTELARILPSSFLFSREEGGKAFYSIEDCIAWAKLLFLAYCRQEFAQIPEYKQVFGNSKISLEEFDLWWEIERHRREEVFEAVEECIDTETAELFVQTGSEFVDEWIANLQERAKSDALSGKVRRLD